MTVTKPLSFRISPDQEKLLDQLSEATDRNRSWHMEKALNAYLATEAWQIEHINSGVDQLDQGDTVSHDKVETWLASWGDETELDQPK
jgi:predicted transcriptional regulator